MNKQEMLESVKSYLNHFSQPKEKIIQAMDKIDRAYFTSQQPYLDTALPIGEGQTISQPSTVARMLQLLDLHKEQEVLEIGTGSGWNAALIAHLIKPGKILSLEQSEKLAEKARQNINKLGMDNIQIAVKDFRKVKKKFDRIIFTAGISPSQQKAIEQFAQSNLREGGRLVCPRTSGPLLILDMQKDGIRKHNTEDEYMFVPLLD
ncbi:MAG: protein-L-isoaspartate O-methyltransferase family protein [Candidatus Nanoarchaeia archaeon]